MLGGIARRATVIDGMEPIPKLIIDLGNFASNSSSDFYRMKADALLETYRAIGYDAVNIGNNEIAYGRDYILEANDMLGGKVISANVLNEDGSPIVQPYLLKDFGSLRIGIIGLVFHQTQLANPRRTQESTLITRPPMEALEEYIPVMRKKDKCDLIIVAGILQPNEIEEITKAYDGQIDVILSGYSFATGDRKGEYAFYYVTPEGPPASTGEHKPYMPRDEANKRTTGIILHRTGQAGKYVGKIHAPIVRKEDGDLAIGEFEALTIDLDETIPDSLMVNEILDDFHRKLGENRDLLNKDIINQRAEHYWQDYPDYIGSRHCTECHREISMVFGRSQHSRALQALTQNQEDNNPECLVCHTTGFGEPEGFKSKSDTWYLTGVTCEACHGPAKEHLGLQLQIRDAKKMKATRKATDEQVQLLKSIQPGYDTKMRREAPEDICLKCHTEQWDPEFDYENDFLLVNHSDALPKPDLGMENLVPPQRDSAIELELPRDPGRIPPDEDGKPRGDADENNGDTRSADND
jgi:hypothetical protein